MLAHKLLKKQNKIALIKKISYSIFIKQLSKNNESQKKSA